MKRRIGDILVRVEAPHFCAGLFIRDEKCVGAAPILRWCIGKTRQQLRAIFQRKGWRACTLPGKIKQENESRPRPAGASLAPDYESGR